MSGKPRLRETYENEVRPALIGRFGRENLYEAPALTKVSVNMRAASARAESDMTKDMEEAVRELSLIVGQRPATTRAKKSIAAFGVREGMPLGCRATLRGARAWEFLDRLFNIALPRIRDFRGLPRDAFDGRGNYTIGIDDQLIFPELGYDDVQRQRGMNITVVTTAQTDEEAAALLEGLGLPLERIDEATA